MQILSSHMQTDPIRAETTKIRSANTIENALTVQVQDQLPNA